jgi:hypothetical protein
MKPKLLAYSVVVAVVLFLAVVLFRIVPWFAEVQVLEPAGSDVSVADSFEGAVFVPGISAGTFTSLSLKDLPSTLPDGYAQSAVYRDGHVFVPAIGHILEYDENGELVRYSDPKVFSCGGGLPAVVSIAGDTLYAACYNEGIYEIDLSANRAVYLFDQNNGLSNVQNLRPAVVGDSLWVASFSGVFRIDRATRAVTSYTGVFGGGCRHDNVRLFTGGDDVWVTSVAGCGAAEYQAATDVWKVYLASDFNRNNIGRVDFDQFVISSDGIFAAHQDGGPDHTVLSKLDRVTDTWTSILDEKWAAFPDAAAAVLPPIESYADVYEVTHLYGTKDSDERGTDWHFNTKDQGWIVLQVPDRRYFAMTKLVGDRYFLLSSSGVEQIVEGQAFPELLVRQTSGNGGWHILASEDGNYVLATSDEIHEMGGDWARTFVTVYDRAKNESFTSVIPGVISDDSGVGVPPLAGFDKDPSSYSLVVKDSSLLVLYEGSPVLTVDLMTRQVTH